LFFTGNPPVAGLSAIGRIRSNGKNRKKVKSTQNFVDPFVTSTFQSMANACTPSTQGKYKEVEVDVLEEEEVESDLEEAGKVVEVTKTENGTSVLVAPTHCIWTFEDSDARVHVGVSVVLPSSVGMTTAQLDAKVSEDGNSLRVHMYHPKDWSQQKFHFEAFRMEGMSVAFQQYCYDGQRKELEKLVKISNSKSRDKILTFAEFVLPESCEAEIRYTVPIHIQDSGVTTYIFILRKVPTKDDILRRKVTKKVHTFSSNPAKPVNTVTTINCEESVNPVYSSENENETYVIGGKRVCCVYD
jgi:hypothetical protein